MKQPAGSIPPSDPQFGGYVVEFRSQVDFLKDLARMSWVDSPPSEKSSEDEKMDHLLAVLDKLADDAIDRLSYENFKTPNQPLTEALVKMAVFLYLEDRLKAFHRESDAMNKDGVYALFDALRDWTENFLTSGYFSRSASENIKIYVMAESQFTAMGELTGVDVPAIQDAASAFQKNVFEKLLEHLKAKEKGAKSAKTGRAQEENAEAKLPPAKAPPPKKEKGKRKEAGAKKR